MTPAEKLAKSKESNPKNGSRPSAVRRVWKCQLRELRTSLDLTQRDVAAAVGLSAAGYHQIETCGNDVTLGTAVKLSEFFGIPISEIWTKPDVV
jgi:putative transcriptional regulator